MMKGSRMTVSGQRIINLGNYRSLHVGGSVEIEFEAADDGKSMELWENAEKAFLRRLNDIADGIEDQVHGGNK
jgi:hypothetical protein